MAEVVTLTTPVPKPTLNTIQIERITLDIFAKSVFIQFLGNNAEAGSASYPTPAPEGSSQMTGASLITMLNKMNFSGSNPSFANRILTRLQADGHIPAGSIAGTPD
jgi:hypothetical protein